MRSANTSEEVASLKIGASAAGGMRLSQNRIVGNGKIAGLSQPIDDLIQL